MTNAFDSSSHLVFISWDGCNNRTQMSWLTQQKLILSQVWRPEICNQDVSRAGLPLKALGEGPSWPHPVTSVPCFVTGFTWSLPLSSHGLFPMCIKAPFLSFYEDTVFGSSPGAKGSHLDPCLNHICKDPIPNKVTVTATVGLGRGRIFFFWGGDAIQPRAPTIKIRNNSIIPPSNSIIIFFFQLKKKQNGAIVSSLFYNLPQPCNAGLCTPFAYQSI